MLLDLATLRPKASSVWMAAAHAGAMDPARARLAISVYKDSTAPLGARVAAATALESVDPAATAFAVNEIEAFLLRFADRDAGSMVAAATQLKAGSRSKEDLKYFWFNSHILIALRILKAPAAEQLTFRYLTARHESIRNFCGVVAALRWPERLLQAGQGTFSGRDYANLMAIVALKHPSLTSVSSRVTPKQMEEAKIEVTNTGVAVFGPVAGALALF
jgi:hypothetical protein